jgi:hypothetical protein
MKDTQRILIWEKDEADLDKLEELEELDDSEESETEHKLHIHLPKQPQLVHTNFGVFDLNSPDNPYNTREIWIAHTNFDITKTDAIKIAAVVGVEAVRILTRYSFTVMIGVMFYFEDVLDTINEVLEIDNNDFDEVSPEESMKLISDNNEIVQEKLKRVADEKFWHLYIFPNGNDIFNVYKSNVEKLELAPFYEKLKTLSEGILLSSDDE